MKRSKVFLFAGAGFVLFSLLTSLIVLGGAVGFMVANSFSQPDAVAVVQPVSNTAPLNQAPTAPAPAVPDTAVPANPVNPADSPEPQNDTAPVSPTAPAQTPSQQSRNTVSAVQRALPAVVTVLNQTQYGSGSGSGFFISDDGYIVTNNHVVEEARELSVVYAQGGVVPATLIGTAPDFDLAVIKIDGYVPATIGWGDSSDLPLGAEVIAIGSALGQYQNSVTAGILSGFNRELGGLRGLLQTDAAINHGNSGGPLVNDQGDVIGINTMVVRGGSSEAEGLGFAIPSNIARNVVSNLIERGEVNPPFLGINYQEVNPQLVIEENLNVTQGALIQNIVNGAPASQAGLQAGDIIVAINSQAVDDRHPLVSLLMEHVAGDSVTLDIMRNGQLQQVQLVLGRSS